MKPYIYSKKLDRYAKQENRVMKLKALGCTDVDIEEFRQRCERTMKPNELIYKRFLHDVYRGEV